MSLHQKIILLFTIALLSLNVSYSQVRVFADLDSTQMLIGDRVQVHLRIQHPASVKIRNVDLSKLEKDEHIEIFNKGRLDTLKSGDLFLLQQDITFTILDSGTFIVPPIAVNFDQSGANSTKMTNDLLMNVFTPSIDSIALAPIRPILKENLNVWDVLPWVAGVLFLLGIIAAIVYWVNKQKGIVAPPPPIRKVPAHEIAFAKLGALKIKELWQKGEIKPYQSELTYIIREYLEGRYKIQALESTTAEIQQQLVPLDFDQNLKGDLTNMLQVADMVKFAKAEPGAEFHAKVLEQAHTFVERTKPAIFIEEYVDADGNPVDTISTGTTPK
ncbi:MAG: hypothetical protein ACI9VN_003746 [Patescibacteria group bacterium]|jgi:hypothetical protein